MVLDREEAAYQARRSELLRTTFGQYVVFVAEEMMGPYSSSTEAMRSAYAKYGYVPIMVRHVGLDESPVTFATVNIIEFDRDP